MRIFHRGQFGVIVQDTIKIHNVHHFLLSSIIVGIHFTSNNLQHIAVSALQQSLANSVFYSHTSNARNQDASILYSGEAKESLKTTSEILLMER